MVDHLFSRQEKDVTQPVVCLLACPRSGSTLTYQILCTGLQSTFVSNLWNLLYATPFIGGKISHRITKDVVSSFKSNYGFVGGIKGEAEGLRFWSYWTGQTLSEEANAWNICKSNSLLRVIERVVPNGRILVTGYLGHVFCIPQLRKMFPSIVFVYLQRNLVENAISILKEMDGELFSTRPLIPKVTTDIERVVHQLLSIHYSIYKNRKEDYVVLRFDKLKNDPVAGIKLVESKCEELNIDMCLSKNVDCLKPFSSSKNIGEAIDKQRVILHSTFMEILNQHTDIEFITEMKSLLDVR